ncbi:hypothetical protein NicSoilC12_32360 [Arthrobacter sp. NicSoilC12]|nr:hypothetical protein NicSoilC12_32360 [Arthrobacter sp. NicSoilC12]
MLGCADLEILRSKNAPTTWGRGIFAYPTMAENPQNREAEQAAAEETQRNQPVPPIAVTAAGEPIYALVGSTADGRPVYSNELAPGTAIPDQATGRTNTMAVLALVFGLLFRVPGIIFGHIVREQIARTGERGAGMAFAGLLLGYLWLGIAILTLFVPR